MSDLPPNTPSVADRVRPVKADRTIVAVHFLDGTPVFVLGEEALLFAGEQGEARVPVHGGAILASASDGKRIVTGGDDGRVVSTGLDAKPNEIATDAKKRWIDQVALGPDNAVAWSAGKTAFVKTKKGEEKTIEAPSTVAGLAFAPKGFRLAIAHYNGVTLWFPNAQAAGEKLEWKGSHLAVGFSPDGRFLVTAMQEPTMHGWRLLDGKHMRMSGYSARVRSFGFTAGGDYLATSGSEQLILWPYDGKDGPMGKQPLMWAPSNARVAAVAPHPRQPIVAVGFADGIVLLVRIEDGAEILVKPKDPAPITALGWDAHGAQLAFGTEDGEAGVVGL
ncbi:MAG: WD40 repeat domain-containing protein [Pseudolabrys sp.]|jgi:WD40 repeat protein|nr:WD40 repeat domain-containing protein [Pseudolabrys sp.]